MANVKTPFDEPDLDSRSLFLYDPSSRAIDDHHCKKLARSPSLRLLFPSLPPLLLPSLSLSLSLLKTVAQPTFIRDHGTPELELHVRKKRFYAATRNESVVNTEPLSLSVFETFLKIAKISGEGQQWPIKRNGKDNDEVVGEIALRIRSLRRIIFVSISFRFTPI